MGRTESLLKALVSGVVHFEPDGGIYYVLNGFEVASRRC